MPTPAGTPPSQPGSRPGSYNLSGGTRVGNYVVTEFHRETRFASLHLGRKLTGSDDTVVLELVHEDLAGDDAFAERFLREAAVLREIKGVGPLPRLLGFGRSLGYLYLARSYVPGEPLDACLRRSSPPPLNRLLSAAEHVTVALEALHRSSLIHGAIRPEVIVLPQDPEIGTIAVLDQVLPGDPAALPREGADEGQRYDSPERVAGKPVDAQSDLYSLGIVLGEAICGHLPGGDDRSEGESGYAHAKMPDEERWDALQKAPAEVRDALYAAIRRSPRDRVAGAGDLRSLLVTARRRLVPEGGVAEEPDAEVPASFSEIIAAARVREQKPAAHRRKTDRARSPGGAGARARPWAEPMETEELPVLRRPPGAPKARKGPWAWAGILGASAALVALILAVAFFAGGVRESGEMLRAREALRTNVARAEDTLARLDHLVADLPGELLSRPASQLAASKARFQGRLAEIQTKEESAVEKGDPEAVRELEAPLSGLNRELDELTGVAQALADAARAYKVALTHADSIESQAADTERRNVQEVELTVGVTLGVLRERAQELGRALRELDPATPLMSRSREVEEIRDEIQIVAASLEKLDIRVAGVIRAFDEAVAQGEERLQQIWDSIRSSQADLEGALPDPEAQAAERKALDAAIETARGLDDELQEVALSAGAAEVRNRLSELASQQRERARYLHDERLRREQEKIIERGEAQAVRLEAYMEQAAAKLGAMQTEGCADRVRQAKEALAAYREPGLPRRERAERALLLLDQVGPARACLGELFVGDATRRRDEVLAVVTRTEDDSTDFQEITDAFQRTMEKLDPRTDPLGMIDAFEEIRFAVYQHLRRQLDRCHAGIASLRSGAPPAGFDEEIGLLELEARKQQEILSRSDPDLARVSVGLQELAGTIKQLAHRMEVAKEKARAERMEAQARATEQEANEWYKSGSLLPSERDTYQRAVLQLGEARRLMQIEEYGEAIGYLEDALRLFAEIKPK